MPHISIKAETLFHVLGFPITNSLLFSSVILFIFLLVGVSYEANSRKETKNSLSYLITFLLKSVYNLFVSIFGEKTMYFFPILGAFFFFILLQNWFGLLPGVGSILLDHVPLLRANTADLNTTLALAFISFTLIQYFGIKFTGFKGYMNKFINFKDPISFFTGILEIIAEFSKIISFSFRLFGNVFAGEVLIVVIAFLIPVLASFPFLILEIFVGFIQAIVFAMLTGIFIKLAITKYQ